MAEYEKNSNLYLRQIFEQSPFAFQVFDAEGNCIETNKAWQDIWQIDVSNYNVLKDPQIKEKGLLPILQEAFNGKVVHPPTIYYDPAASGLSGHAGWVSSVLFPIFDENKKVVAVVHANQDVTDQKKLEQDMLDKIKQLEVFYNASVGRELKMVELKEELGKITNELQDLKKRFSK